MNRILKTITIFALITTLLSFTLATAQAADSLTLTIVASEGSVAIGAEIEISVILGDAAGTDLSAFSFYIELSSGLRIKTGSGKIAESFQQTTGMYMAAFDETPLMMISGFGGGGYNGGALKIATFTCIAETPGAHKADISSIKLYGANGYQIPATKSPATITVLNRAPDATISTEPNKNVTDGGVDNNKGDHENGNSGASTLSTPVPTPTTTPNTTPATTPTTTPTHTPTLTQIQEGDVPGGGAGHETPSPYSSKMYDIGPDHWAAAYINTLVERGIVDGYPQPDGTYVFMPENEISRAEVVKLIATALELPFEGSFNGSAFTDWDTVATWAKPYIGALVKAGILLGSQEGNSLLVNADSSVTRQEMIAMTVRALGINVPEGGIPKNSISDFETSTVWGRDYLAFALDNGMINTDGGKARPLENAKRAEVAMTLFEMLQFVDL